MEHSSAVLVILHASVHIGFAMALDTALLAAMRIVVVSTRKNFTTCFETAFKTL